MKRITIKDLAQQAGVNPSTVSRALKDHPDISPALRDRVKQLAEQLHYRPNHMAVYLRQRTSRLVGLVIPEITMFFYPSLIKGVEQVLHNHGFSLVMLPSNESLDRETENIQICFDNDVAGLLIAFSRETNNTEHLALLEEAGAPIVMVDKVLENSGFDAVVLDDYSDARAAVTHLVATGCQRIAGVFGNPNMHITQLRLKGFTDVLKASQLPLDPEQLLFANDAAEAQECVQQLLRAPLPPDGLFAMSDEIITGALPALLDSGRKIPDDCAVVCMSDGLLPHFLRPQVTFLRHDGFALGQLAAERLCAMIKSGEHLQADYQGRQIVLEAQLIEQETTRPLNALALK
ncbi:MAG: LacI family DNA-binding transcriptional regulator [Saprospiraceae bacterium]|nr:LacI family DNA-binding transcriptional regulator [Saprospiraceae bacterium]